MTKEMQIKAWCDGPHEHRTEATREQHISLDPKRDSTIDLCESHYMQLVAPLEAVVKENGVTVASNKAGLNMPRKKTATSSRPGNGPEKCNQCSHGSTTRGGLAQHLRVHHNMSLAEAGL